MNQLEPPPNIARTEQAIEGRRARSVEATLLTVLAMLYTLYFARAFLIPIVFALLLNFLLSPLIRLLARAGIKAPLGAAFLVVMLLATTGLGMYELAAPAQRWAASAPETLKSTQLKLRKIIRPMQQVSKNVEQAADAVGGNAPGKPVVV